MGSNPQADDKTKVSFQVTKDQMQLIRELAKTSGKGVSEYCRGILEIGLRDGIVFKEVVEATKRKAPATVKKRNGKIA